MVSPLGPVPVFCADVSTQMSSRVEENVVPKQRFYTRKPVPETSLTAQFVHEIVRGEFSNAVTSVEIRKEAELLGKAEIEEEFHWGTSGPALCVTINFFQNAPGREEETAKIFRALFQSVVEFGSPIGTRPINIFDARKVQSPSLQKFGLETSTYDVGDTDHAWGDLYNWEMYGTNELQPCLALPAGCREDLTKRACTQPIF